jgi:hypothetical protein
MIIYNVTIKIDKEVEKDWYKYMITQHIPDVMSTGKFKEYRLSKVMVDDDEGSNYSIQYLCSDMKTLEDYQKNHAEPLQKEHAERYRDKFVAFRTLLEVVDHNSKI